MPFEPEGTERSRKEFLVQVAIRLLLALAMAAAVLTRPASAEVRELGPGLAVEQPGVFMDEAGTRKLIEDLRDGDTARAQLRETQATVEDQKAAIAELRGALDSLKKGARDQELALAIAKDRDERRREDGESMSKAIDRAIAAADRAEARLKASDEMIVRMNEQVLKLHAELRTTRLLGAIPLVGMFAWFFMR